VAKRVALFIASLRGGGAERIMVNLAQGFADRGLEVDLVLPQVEGPYLDDVPKSVRIVDLHAPRVLQSLPGLVRYLRRERPATLISAVNHANVVALWAKRLAGGPTRTVVTVHNTLSASTQNAWNRRQRSLPKVIGWSFPWADEIVAVSEGVAEDLVATAGLPRQRLRVIYNPVVTPELTNLAEEPLEHPWFAPGQPPVFLGVGRLAAQKDFPTLLRAFALLRRDTHARLLILGEGRERPQLEALVRELDLDSSVSLPGFVRNPFAFLKRASTFVLSSSWEGLPTVLIEALALGVPIVSTDCKSGPSEILQGGKYGRLVPVGDAATLAVAMRASLAEPSPPADEATLRQFTFEASLNAYLQVTGVAGRV
jgi:glycosyltransferase involved in cell wall biosynthesis